MEVNGLMKAYIAERVEESSGIKRAELSFLACEHYLTYKELDPTFITRHPDFLIDEVCEERKFVVVQYVLPSMSYRQKAIIFPAGTEFLS